MESAHSLLGTYFGARKRSNLFQAQQREGIHAKLAVVDVDNAILSAEVIKRGQAFEHGGQVRWETGNMADAKELESAKEIPGRQGSKRKSSARDVLCGGQSSPVGKARRLTSHARSTADPQSRRSKKSKSSKSTMLAGSSANIASKLRISSIPDDFLPPTDTTDPNLSISDRPTSTTNPTLHLTHSNPCAIPAPIAAPTASEMTIYSPNSSTLEFLPTPSLATADSTMRLSPISELIQEIGTHDRAIALLIESANEKASELQVKRLKFEEAQVALEVARQKRVVATNKMTSALLEMEKQGWPRHPEALERWEG